jgi:lipopolysaccharide transport system permease protein
MKLLFLPFSSFKFLLYQLTQKEIKARYKQSIVGYAWVLLNPMALLLVYSFVFSVIFRFSTGQVPYSIFLFAALLPWTFFQSSILAGTQSLVSHADLLKKVSFPRETIPYSVVFAKIIDFIFSAVVFVILLMLFQVQLAGTFYLFFPLFAVQIILTIGITLFLAAANLFYRDIQHLANLLMVLWFYVTPIVYPLSLVPQNYLWLYKINPMVGLVEGYRSALFGYPFEFTMLWWSLLLSLLVFIAGFLFFKRVEKIFADIV